VIGERKIVFKKIIFCAIISKIYNELL